MSLTLERTIMHLLGASNETCPTHNIIKDFCGGKSGRYDWHFIAYHRVFFSNIYEHGLWIWGEVELLVFIPLKKGKANISSCTENTHHNYIPRLFFLAEVL